MGSTKSTMNKTDTKWRHADEVQQAKNIFITSTNDRDYNDEPEKPDMDDKEVKEREMKSPTLSEKTEGNIETVDKQNQEPTDIAVNQNKSNA